MYTGGTRISILIIFDMLQNIIALYSDIQARTKKPQLVELGLGVILMFMIGARRSDTIYRMANLARMLTYTRNPNLTSLPMLQTFATGAL